jgi:predicted nucleic acid-binding protein
LDTNIIIYSLDIQAPAKREVARSIVATACNQGTGIISYQVVQEALNTLARKFAGVLNAADTQTLLDKTLLPLMKVMPSAALFSCALQVQSRYQLSFYDSLIIAAAQTAGCKRLLTEDLQHGQVMDGLKIVNPFR